VAVFLTTKNGQKRQRPTQKRPQKTATSRRRSASPEKHNTSPGGSRKPALPAAGPALPADDVDRIRSFVWLAQIQAEHILRRLREVDELLEEFIKPVGALAR